MRALLFIAGKDLRGRLRDRTALLMAFVAPLAIAAIMSVALGGLSENVHATVGVVDADHGPVAAALQRVLRAPDARKVVTARPVASEAAASRLLEDGDLGAAIVIPAGFSNQAGPHPPRLVVLARPDDPVARAVAAAFADGFMVRVSATRLAVTTVAATNSLPPDALQALAGEAAAGAGADSLADRSPGKAMPPVSYYGPAMGIVFLFFLAGFGARSFLVERRDNTLARLLVAPVPRAAVVLGKTLATFVLGITSLLVLCGASSIVFHARWGDPLAVVGLAAGIVLAVMALTALITTFARTDEQANGYLGIMTFVLALLGGNFIAVYDLPPALRTLSAFTPNGQALRGFADLGAGAGGIGAVATPLGIVFGFAIVCGALAAWRAPKLVAA